MLRQHAPHCLRCTASAAGFLEKLTAEMPFPVTAIQVDGVSEFEQACANKNIRFYALPPKSPKMDGAVERCNSTGGTSSIPSTTCRLTSTPSTPSSTRTRLDAVTPF
jgi:hypothetical protein